MLSAGTKLGPYEIVSPLGAGGMGEVYRARDTRLNRDVAIKVLPPEFAKDVSRLARFEQEATATAALNHPNIVVVFDVGVEGPQPYVASEATDARAGASIAATMRPETTPGVVLGTVGSGDAHVRRGRKRALSLDRFWPKARSDTVESQSFHRFVHAGG